MSTSPDVTHTALTGKHIAIRTTKSLTNVTGQVPIHSPGTWRPDQHRHPSEGGMGFDESCARRGRAVPADGYHAFGQTALPRA
jgi:hypothetical protein